MFKLVVLSCVLAVAVAAPGVLGPYGLGAPLGLAGPLGLGAPLGLAAPWAGWGAPLAGPYNYRGPLSLAPGQPANVLAADGRPLDTLDVNLDRAAHYTARAVDHSGVHLLKKRSAVLAPLAVSHTARIDLPARVIAPAHLGWPAAPYAAPYGLAPAHLGWHGPIAAPLGHLW